MSSHITLALLVCRCLVNIIGAIRHQIRRVCVVTVQVVHSFSFVGRNSFESGEKGLWERRLEGVFCVIERDDRPVSLASGQLFTMRKAHLSPKWVWLAVSDCRKKSIVSTAMPGWMRVSAHLPRCRDGMCSALGGMACKRAEERRAAVPAVCRPVPEPYRSAQPCALERAGTGSVRQGFGPAPVDSVCQLPSASAVTEVCSHSLLQPGPECTRAPAWRRRVAPNDSVSAILFSLLFKN
ncbi:hypothetical protein IRJ41_025056 [Triplophysa rosa]|uniref:Secreted protein n=1 Tax=Triplophysa rosa TaxID=992332 RepID=A0A9W7WC70_TRIRA|nr:hypothetical protein IRJ41_025056 [Triplophysa rosa]